MPAKSPKPSTTRAVALSTPPESSKRHPDRAGSLCPPTARTECRALPRRALGCKEPRAPKSFQLNYREIRRGNRRTERPELFSAIGALHTSLGQRPRFPIANTARAESPPQHTTKRREFDASSNNLGQ